MSLAGLMTQPSHVLSPDSTVLEAARLMSERVLGAVTVESEECLCGIFTYRDLIDRVVLPRLPPETTPIGTVMTPDVESLSKDASYADALRLMVANDYTYVPIVDSNNRVLGLVSLRDLLQHRINDLAVELDAMSKYHAVDGPGG